jgi:uncharacterized OsmC-like protein
LPVRESVSPSREVTNMNGADHIRTALERNVKAVSLRPGVGRGTARTTASLGPGLACRVVEGDHVLTVGITEKYGGTDAGPNPGVLARGALASCLALGYAMWAARSGLELHALDVEVQADYDVRGELGVDADVRPGYAAVRYVVTVESPASEEEVLEVLDACDRTSSLLDVFSNPVPVRREVRIAPPAGASSKSAGEGR